MRTVSSALVTHGASAGDPLTEMLVARRRSSITNVARTVIVGAADAIESRRTQSVMEGMVRSMALRTTDADSDPRVVNAPSDDDTRRRRAAMGGVVAGGVVVTCRDGEALEVDAVEVGGDADPVDAADPADVVEPIEGSAVPLFGVAGSGVADPVAVGIVDPVGAAARSVGGVRPVADIVTVSRDVIDRRGGVFTFTFVAVELGLDSIGVAAAVRVAFEPDELGLGSIAVGGVAVLVSVAVVLASFEAMLEGRSRFAPRQPITASVIAAASAANAAMRALDRGAIGVEVGGDGIVVAACGAGAERSSTAAWTVFVVEDTASRAAITSTVVAKRSSGLIDNRRATSASSAGGTLTGARDAIGGGVSDAFRRITSNAVPSCGVFPVSISYIVTPRENWSARASTTPPLAFSGAM